MKNVARTYSLEHEGESVLFDQLFTLLDQNMQTEESHRRELASCTGALYTSISQHMSKEEEQVTFVQCLTYMSIKCSCNEMGTMYIRWIICISKIMWYKRTYGCLVST